MPEHVGELRENSVDGALLVSLGEGELAELQINSGLQRKRVLAKLATLKAAGGGGGGGGGGSSGAGAASASARGSADTPGGAGGAGAQCKPEPAFKRQRVESPVADSPGGGPAVTLKIKSGSGQDMKLRVKRSAGMDKVMAAWCKKWNLEASKLRLLADGVRLIHLNGLPGGTPPHSVQQVLDIMGVTEEELLEPDEGTGGPFEVQLDVMAEMDGG